MCLYINTNFRAVSDFRIHEKNKFLLFSWRKWSLKKALGMQIWGAFYMFLGRSPIGFEPQLPTALPCSKRHSLTCFYSFHISAFPYPPSKPLAYKPFCQTLLFWAIQARIYSFQNITNIKKVWCVVLSKMNFKGKIAPKIFSFTK